jgi:putative endonuclease
MSEDARQVLGARGEAIARSHLSARGLTILDQNFRTRYGELDLVAEDRRWLVFCEVKTRIGRGYAGDPAPLEAVGPRKRRQLRFMAREWLASRARERGAGAAELRFDAIGVLLDPGGRLLSLEHIEGAF